jgi:hypothetical protein
MEIGAVPSGLDHRTSASRHCRAGLSHTAAARLMRLYLPPFAIQHDLQHGLLQDTIIQPSRLPSGADLLTAALYGISRG